MLIGCDENCTWSLIIQYKMSSSVAVQMRNNLCNLWYLWLLHLPALFQMPKMQFRSNAKPSMYAYPEPLKPPKKEEKEKVQLSEG